MNFVQGVNAEFEKVLFLSDRVALKAPFLVILAARVLLTKAGPSTARYIKFNVLQMIMEAP